MREACAGRGKAESAPGSSATGTSSEVSGGSPPGDRTLTIRTIVLVFLAICRGRDAVGPSEAGRTLSSDGLRSRGENAGESRVGADPGAEISRDETREFAHEAVVDA